ncbi:putative sigma factor SigB regulation protein rsbQ [Leptospira kirschneri str. 200803703]|uniref:Sigma factor SigB regulation protein rsbQ n=1 Tax=Leptospira kirschneri str. 200802841 TaxID=1193047 RepID=A0A828XYV3_9LEPT|nr:alpha/beta hydrolase [Leptospira kirschneri]EJO69425.1 putative sigma factor SigB regulation protein rsbQ [Leptospira kirschneri serovar Grippotyphosa str. RM52]EKO49836.1 putative sigma factor SigB regulation protein rsbQ [Leptospira kirschneri str. 200802841]EKP05661.1 putative sigma factor SigB regulation protein rsbQ [Leptospira kirschneri str. 2008720114]EKR08958.1 putative sigma factor SigB regulation protein rsbQ [Leptospira kirschneri serovar Valbuzzi str. 200702274]EMK04921.1 putat
MQRASNHNLKIIGSGMETIVFSHGFGCDQSTWNKLIPNLKDHYKLILFDTIGSGKTDTSLFSADRYSNLYSYAEDLVLLMDELKIRNSLYVGHSVSGMIGLIASIRRPELFSKLTFISASPRYLNDTNYKGGFEQTDLDQLFAAMETNFFSWAGGFAPLVMGNPDRPELAQSFAESLREIRPDIGLTVSRTIFQSDHRKDLNQCKRPVLILQPSSDIAVPIEVGKYLSEKIPQAIFKSIPATGHLPHFSSPESVLQEIKSFFKSSN